LELKFSNVSMFVTLNSAPLLARKQHLTLVCEIKFANLKHGKAADICGLTA